MRTPGWLRRLGLMGAAAKIFAAGAYAPLDGEMREALAALFEMRWPGVEHEPSARERSTYRRIGLPESPDLLRCRSARLLCLLHRHGILRRGTVKERSGPATMGKLPT